VSAELLSSLKFIPFSVLVIPGSKPIVLSQDEETVSFLEGAMDLGVLLAEKTPFSYKGYRILPRSVTTYQPNRFIYDCLAIKVSTPNKS
jgi:hypothetical protein